MFCGSELPYFARELAATIRSQHTSRDTLLMHVDAATGRMQHCQIFHALSFHCNLLWPSSVGMPDRGDSLPRAQPAKAWQQCVVPEGIRVRLLGGLDSHNASLASFPASGLPRPYCNSSRFSCGVVGPSLMMAVGEICLFCFERPGERSRFRTSLSRDQAYTLSIFF